MSDAQAADIQDNTTIPLQLLTRHNGQLDTDVLCRNDRLRTDLQQELSPNQSATAFRTHPYPYTARLRELSHQLPHIVNTPSASRNARINITILDYSGPIVCRTEVLDDEDPKRVDYGPMREIICARSTGPFVDTRLLIVEDLSRPAIDLLGSTLDLSPEFFEEHLHRSGYQDGTQDDPMPQTWSTNNMEKNYVSLKWYRPVNRWNQEPNSLAQRELLLEANQLTGIDLIEFYNRGRMTQVPLQYSIKPDTNIFRPEFSMATDPDGIIPKTAPCSWEERATACKVELNGLQCVILLLDPMPLLTKELTGPKNVHSHDMMMVVDQSSTFSNCVKYEPSQVSHSRVTKRVCMSPFTQNSSRTPWTMSYKEYFSELCRFESQVLVPKLNWFQSTRNAFVTWLLLAAPGETAMYTNRLGPASMIFRIVHQDTLDLLQLMRLALSEINRASDDKILQERALHWRYRLDQFRAQLVELEESLQQFDGFLYPPSKTCPPQEQVELDTNPIRYLLSDGHKQISLLDQRIRDAYTSLTSKVQINDSHRSIAEAETVTKLTELAFLFLPTSFATSIFSMQIISNSTPISTYVVVAVSLTSLVYSIRYLIYRTKESRKTLVGSIRTNIEGYAGLRVGSRIPTVVLLKWLFDLSWIRPHYSGWMYSRYWIILSVITFLMIIVVPLPVLWTSNVETGILTAITCLLSIVVLLVVSFSLVRNRRR